MLFLALIKSDMGLSTICIDAFVINVVVHIQKYTVFLIRQYTFGFINMHCATGLVAKVMFNT